MSIGPSSAEPVTPQQTEETMRERLSYKFNCGGPVGAANRVLPRLSSRAPELAAALVFDRDANRPLI